MQREVAVDPESEGIIRWPLQAGIFMRGYALHTLKQFAELYDVAFDYSERRWLLTSNITLRVQGRCRNLLKFSTAIVKYL